MDNIFEIKFPIETNIKENVITKFANKQGGDYNIFSYYWQCFVWAATIGFLRDERKPLGTGIERIFTLNTMVANNGEKDARALICMCIARTGSLDIMKEPSDAIQLISEYANGGFYHILKLMENGENTFNDMEKVKQEIFSRNYVEDERTKEVDVEKKYTIPEVVNSNDFASDYFVAEYDANKEQKAIYEVESDKNEVKQKVKSRWTASDRSLLSSYYKQGMTVEQLAVFFNSDVASINSTLKKMRLL